VSAPVVLVPIGLSFLLVVVAPWQRDLPVLMLHEHELHRQPQAAEDPGHALLLVLGPVVVAFVWVELERLRLALS
jgi:hypothetical protein